MPIERIVLLALLAACAPGPAPSTDRADEVQRIILTDRRGESWDITDAVRDFGFDRHYFEYGIGRHAIPPINAPQMAKIGDRDFPPNSSDHQVISLQIKGENRSYPIRELTRHEIVNESVGSTQAAIAY